MPAATHFNLKVIFYFEASILSFCDFCVWFVFSLFWNFAIAKQR